MKTAWCGRFGSTEEVNHAYFGVQVANCFLVRERREYVDCGRQQMVIQ